MTFELLREYWQENIKTNIKKISAVLGDIIMGVIIVALYAAKSGIEITTMLMMMALSIRPYLFQSINLVFKGEKVDLAQSNMQLREKLSHLREISEYKIGLAAAKGGIPDAIKANKTWNDTNEALKDEE